MRFMSNSYDKLFPRPEEAPEQIETAVEGFTPTADLVQDKKPEAPAPVVSTKTPETPAAPQPEPIREISEEGTADGNAVNNNFNS